MNDTLKYDQTAASFNTVVEQTKTIKKPGQEKGERVWQSNLSLTMFTLSAVFPDAPPYALVETENGPEKEKGQQAVYQDEKVNYLYQSFASRVEQAAKQKKDGAPAETLEELLTATRGGTYLADLSAAKKLFRAILEGSGNTKAQVDESLAYFDTKVIRRTTPEIKRDMAAMLRLIVDNVDEAKPLAYIFEAVIKAATEEQEGASGLAKLNL